MTGCSFPFFSGGDETPTPNITQAYETVNAKLTMTLAVAQTRTLTVETSPTKSSTSTPTITEARSSPTNTATQNLNTPSPRCNLAAAGNPIDVTIPDDTRMAPGQQFTKTWRLVNIGECTWTTDYSIVFYTGEQMGAPLKVPLPNQVGNGQSIDVSVNMIAPQSIGLHQGYWKLSTPSGTQFGIGPNSDSPFWVRIEVTASAVQTITSSPFAPTMTATPGVKVSTTVNLFPSNTLDLDTGSINTGGGDDLTYVNVAQGVHQLQMLGISVIGVYGGNKPEQVDCQATSPSGKFINVEGLLPGTYLCYVTGSGLIGRAMYNGQDPNNASISLEIYTWSSP